MKLDKVLFLKGPTESIDAVATGGLNWAMDREQERKHLARVDRHIADLRDDIERQWQIIKELSVGGHPMHGAISMLTLLKSHLRIMERHRQSILDELEKAK